MMIFHPYTFINIIFSAEEKTLINRYHIKILLDEWVKPGHFSKTVVRDHKTTL